MENEGSVYAGKQSWPSTSCRDWLSSPTEVYTQRVLWEKLIQREDSRGMQIWSKVSDINTPSDACPSHAPKTTSAQKTLLVLLTNSTSISAKRQWTI